MISHTFLPHRSLREYVKCYHLRHFVFSAGDVLPFKPYAPRPEHSLVFYPRSHEVVEHVSDGTRIKRPRSILLGQYVERTNRQLGGADFIVLIIEFHPGVLYRITGIPFYEFTNSFIDAEAIFPGIIDVNKRLNSTDRYDEMIAIVENFSRSLVSGIACDIHPVDRAAQDLVLRGTSTNIDRLADDCCLSPRQLERKFKERLGVSPKLFIRIARLTKACRAKHLNPSTDWLSIAILCGYHDQQHLIKDFKSLAGATPSVYFQEDQNAPETFLGLRDTSMTN